MTSTHSSGRSDLKFHIERAHIERSRAFYDIAGSLAGPVKLVWRRAGELSRRSQIRYVHWRQRQRDIAALAQLDPRTLRDIGLLPSNIGAATTDRSVAGYASEILALSSELVPANDDREKSTLKLAI